MRSILSLCSFAWLLVGFVPQAAEPLVPPPVRALPGASSVPGTSSVVSASNLNAGLAGTNAVLSTNSSRTNVLTAQPLRRSVPTPLPPLEFKDGDRVVFLGDDLLEGDSKAGYFETRLTEQFPDRAVVVVNLSASASVAVGAEPALARGDWHKPILHEVAELKATVVFLGYGTSASSAGEVGLPSFRSNYTALIEGLQALDTNAPIRCVAVSPMAFEGSPVALKAVEVNNRLSAYADVVQNVAEARKLHFVNLFNLASAFARRAQLSTNTQAEPRLTVDGVHLNDFGYWRLVPALEQGVRWSPNNWRFGLLTNNTFRAGGFGVILADHQRSDTFVKARCTFERLPKPPVPGRLELPADDLLQCFIQVPGFKPGRYTLTLGGRPILTGSEKDWARYEVVTEGPLWDQAEQLRLAIVRKNQIAASRYLPATLASPFPFRQRNLKLEAKQLTEQDTLLAEAQAQIAQLRQPPAQDLIIGAVPPSLKPGSTVVPPPPPVPTAPRAAPADSK